MQLLPHQIEDARFLASRPGTSGCFSGMGTGKTLTALEAWKRSDANTVLIIAPPIALRMWNAEAERHCDYHTQILKTGKTKIDPEVGVLVCSYQIAASRQAELFSWLRADCSALILDESHALKNYKAKRTKAILGKGGLASAAFYTWCLTGTPVTRWNDDLLPFLCRAAPEVINERCGGLSIEKFMLRYTVRQERKFPGARWPVKLVVGARNTPELREILYGAGGCAVRRELKEVWDAMPPLTINTYHIKLAASPELRAALKAIEKQSISSISQQLQAKEPALSTIRREIGEAKIEASADVLAERIEAGSGPVLVGAWHTNVIDLLVDNLAARGLRVAALDGRSSQVRKAELEQAWNEGELDILVGQIAAMGVSLNLQRGGNSIVVVEADWSPEIQAQFYARLHRMGQEKSVHIDILSAGTKLELAIERIAAAKTSNAAKLNEVN